MTLSVSSEGRRGISSKQTTTTYFLIFTYHFLSFALVIWSCIKSAIETVSSYKLRVINNSIVLIYYHDKVRRQLSDAVTKLTERSGQLEAPANQ